MFVNKNKQGFQAIFLKVYFLLLVLNFIIFLNILFVLLQLSDQIVNNKTKKIDNSVKVINCLSNFYIFQIRTLNVFTFGNLLKNDKAQKIENYLQRAPEILKEVIGTNKDKTYFLLLQNNMEIRPSGGFMGSYAKIKLKNGGLSEIIFQDIYVPDGQIIGHVDPPFPIQQAFKQGWYRLRDSNWEIDFPTASETIIWFFEKGNEENVDGLIAINMSLIKPLLKVFGPIKLLDYPQEINEDNLYSTTQTYTEMNFFPGSTQKKDIIGELGKSFIQKIMNINKKQKISLIKIIIENFINKNILLYSKDSFVQNIFKEFKVDGRIMEASDDFLYIVESNLGANKANCCIERRVKHKIDFSKDTVFEELEIVYLNNNISSSPKKPNSFGGDYLNYLRILLPQNISEYEVLVDNKNLPGKEILGKEIKDKKEIGFFVKTKAKEESKVLIKYQRPKKLDNKYKIYYQKQPGIDRIPFEIISKNSTVKNFYLDKDKIFEFNIDYN